MTAAVIPYTLGMGRWGPDTRGRLERAALELYLERGFEQTTVAEIAGRAGLTERTFFRHFADKREVLFGGAALLQALIADAVMAAPGSVAPMEAVALGLEAAAAVFEERAAYSRRRQHIIASNAELQARERSKLAALAGAVAEALRRRGVAESEAALTAEAGILVFRAAFERWIGEANPHGWTQLVRASLRDLRAVVAG